MSEFFIKGLSVRTIYQEDWDKIGDIFDKYGSYIRSYTPALTIQELKNIELADQLTQELKSNPKIRQVALNAIDDETTVECRIFEQLLWLIPEFNRQFAKEALKEFLINGNADHDIHNLFTIDGKRKRAKQEIEMVTLDIIKKILGGKK